MEMWEPRPEKILFRVYCIRGRESCCEVVAVLRAHGFDVRDARRPHMHVFEGVTGWLANRLSPARRRECPEHEFEKVMGSYSEAYNLAHELFKEGAGRIAPVEFGPADWTWPRT